MTSTVADRPRTTPTTPATPPPGKTAPGSTSTASTTSTTTKSAPTTTTPGKAPVSDFDDESTYTESTNSALRRVGVNVRELPRSATTEPTTQGSTDAAAIEDDDVIKVDTNEPASSLSEVSDAALRDARLQVRSGKDPLRSAPAALKAAYDAFIASRFSATEAEKVKNDPGLKAAFVDFASSWRKRFGASADVKDEDARVVMKDAAMKVLGNRKALLEKGQPPGTRAPLDWAMRVLENPATPITPQDELVLQGYRFLVEKPVVEKPAPQRQTPTVPGRTPTSVTVQPDATETVTALSVVNRGRTVPGVVYNVAEIMKLPDELRGETLFRRSAARQGFTQAAIDVALERGRNEGWDLFTNGPDYKTHTTTEELQKRIDAGVAKGQEPGDVTDSYRLTPGTLGVLGAARLAVRAGYDSLDKWQTEKGTTVGSLFTEATIGHLQRNKEMRESLGLDNPVSRALDEYGAELSKVGGNLLNLGQVLLYEKPASFLQGYDKKLPPEREALMDDSMDRVEKSTKQFQASIPEETTWYNSVARGVTGAVVRLPQYAAFSVAPPLAIFYNAGKHANDPFDKFAGGLAQDWLMLGVGKLVEVPGQLAAKSLGDVLRRQVGQEALERTTTWAAIKAVEKGTVMTAGGLGNVAQGAPMILTEAMQAPVVLQDGTKRAPTKEEVKQRLVQGFSREFATGMGMAVLNKAQRDADLKLFADEGSTVPKTAKVFATMLDGQPEYATIVEKGGRAEMVTVDLASEKGRALLSDARNAGRIIEATNEAVDSALISSRLNNRVTKQNAPLLQKEATRYADAQMLQKAAMQQAAKTTQGVVRTTLGNVVDDVAALDGEISKQSGGLQKNSLTAAQTKAAFGDGPYTQDLASMLRQGEFAQLAKQRPELARRLYDATAYTDAAAATRKQISSYQKAGVDVDFDGLANNLEARRPTVRTEGAFEVREFPKGNVDMPAIDVVLGKELDHNGAFHQKIGLGKDEALVSTKPTRGMPFADQILGSDGQPLTDLSRAAILRRAGSPDGFAGASTQEAARLMADSIVKSKRPIDQVVLVACNQADRRSFSFTTNGREFEKALQAELQKRGMRVEVMAAKEAGVTSNYGNVDGQYTADGKQKLTMKSPATSKLPKSPTADELKAAAYLGLGAAGGAGALGAGGLAGYVIYRIVSDDEPNKPR